MGFNGYTSYAASKDIAVIQVREYEGNTPFRDVSPALNVVDAKKIELSGAQFDIISYGMGDGTKNGSQYYQTEPDRTSCTYKGMRSHYTAFLHDCDTLPGQSGMALVVDKSQVVGIHTGSVDHMGLNSAAMLTGEVLDEVRDIAYFKYDALEHFKAYDWDEPGYSRIELYNRCDTDILVGFRYYSMDISGIL
ncbi:MULTISPECIES: hypothetical protein [unclassified Ruegeria]|uniref:hypothetical protein n=1 Tax=unclassified Ruegeria TaxID=2625375 RepID=UPI001487EDD9|nr:MULTISPECIES: hypothetical protein [unclassified Ruegeria]NOD65810.1 hypothetical protein [Ruegeria sp. HKCCD6109]